MKLLPCTSQIIEEVERVTDRPVVMQEDASLGTPAHLQIARGEDALHLLRYKPAGETPPDHLIVYQCAHVLRLYAAPPDKRFDFAVGPGARQKLVQEMLSGQLAPHARELEEMLLGGLVTQLRSLPIGFRIEEWISRTLPELSELQKVTAEAQLEQSLASIRIAASGVFPRPITAANLAMNAASAAYWARKWNDPTPTIPYKAAGQLDAGLKLLAIVDCSPDDPALDPQLVHDWASELRLQGWYEAIPFPGTN